ncbi:tyrosine-protein kinase hopscotch [Copidosoma floridanum]|uniref:tyrosine-protein kinase hopscotch n=1 Tax=Copidosoma floridanum TaxID=29053 RepID=UPI0006C9CA16|nr:tyrosine-protein kinase hopscotch [Copidosoma floridanum]
MEEDRIASISVATEVKILIITYVNGSTAEDLCMKICQQLGIGPVARHLFALKNKATDNWYHASYKFDGKDKYKLDFRLRFKPSSLQRLKRVDVKAHDYYFQQARSDVLDNKVPDIVYEKHKKELIGLSVSDMYRVMLEKEMTREVIESDYKKYIPKECIKRHSFFIKKPIHDALGKISAQDSLFVREQYLKQFENMAPNYLCEEYKAMMEKGMPSPPARVLLRISAKEIGYNELEINNSEWKTLCSIEDLCFISIRKDDNVVEVSRNNGIPSYLMFKSISLLMSFVSALDGYYRLAARWTYNLCGDAVTPSLERLHRLKCHGPVGGEFSYAKLDNERSNRPGTFILRESETKYNAYYLDACGKDLKPRTWRIEKLGPEDFALSDSMQRFKSIAELLSAHKDPENSLYLNECLFPSERDVSPLLLCAPERMKSDVTAEEEIITGVLEARPGSVLPHELQVYKAQPFPKSKASQARVNAASCGGSVTILYKAVWRIAKGKKVEAVIKLLKEDDKQSTREFLKLQAKWGQLRSSALVRLYGFTLIPSLGMLLELINLGPLDAYLRESPEQIIKTIDMVDAAACLTSALWYLENHNFVHGNIRCRKLMVQEHTDNSFQVKLADPGIFSYKPADVHWLPPECYENPDLARRTTLADVWAVGTTMWEIFSRGTIIPCDNDPNVIKKFYASGKRLPIPNGCPHEVYELMTECWGKIGGSRKTPLAIMRDINRIKFQVHNSRKNHAYASAFPKLAEHRNSDVIEDDASETDQRHSSFDGESRASSLFTDRTSLPWDEIDDSLGILGADGNGMIFDDSDNILSTCLGWWAKGSISDNTGENGYDNDNGLLGQMQSIFELDANVNLILQGRIGQGFYGDVYVGALERNNGKDVEPQRVAVKKLKMRAMEAELRDFEREIDIMKSLKHPNIVGILGIVLEPEVCLVMEFIEHGSLLTYLALYRERLTHKKLLGFGLDISTGMDYLGRKKIVHRDLAARNILVVDDNRVKISDFGLAQVIEKNDYYVFQTNRDLPVKWYAPESLKDGRFSPRSDVWSFGVTLYETFSFGEDPILPELIKKTNAGESGKTVNGTRRVEEILSTEIIAALERGARLPCPVTCPQDVYVKIMYPCWHMQSNQRPDFAKLCTDIKELIESKY